MENLTLFTIGFCIFSSYLFFLLRMISRQHNIQKNTHSSAMKSENKVDQEKDASI